MVDIKHHSNFARFLAALFITELAKDISYHAIAYYDNLK